MGNTLQAILPYILLVIRIVIVTVDILTVRNRRSAFRRLARTTAWLVSLPVTRNTMDFHTVSRLALWRHRVYRDSVLCYFEQSLKVMLKAPSASVEQIKV